jgi:hypothetical protein
LLPHDIPGLCNSGCDNATDTINYEEFKFMRYTCEIDNRGQLTTKKGIVNTVSIPQGWQVHKKGGVPQGGYLGQGYYKFVFKVSNFAALKLLPP